MVRGQLHDRDAPADRTQSAAPPEAGTTPRSPTGREDAMTKTCEHQRTEKRDGKTYCRGCKRQLYL
ncbi:hypothetical protein [Streptomyces pinistramenti]|uniref:hypothetical protein n=1 Tax=Streptomyces pinistramenti TaxID=2884812 RepID=UPI001D07EAC2|nr:hypothetical protein [Streptomyces pinistramenti]MCB5910825.1 hypothetical protein [Streptomyces pinistramenti]